MQNIRHETGETQMTSSLEDIVDFPVWLDAMRQPDANAGRRV